MLRNYKFAQFFLMVFVVCWLIAGCGSPTEPDEEDFPTGLSIQKISNFSVKLTWDYEYTGTDTLYYQISRKVGTGGWEDNYAETDSDTKEFIDYIPTTDSVAYAYQVRYYNSSTAETSQYSEAVAWLSENTNPSQMTITQLSQQLLEINWNDHCIGEQGYIVDKKVNGGSWENAYMILEADVDQINDTVALFDSVSYRVYAWLGVSETEALIGNYFATLLSPSGLQCTVPDLNKIRLNWLDNSDGEAGFYIDKKVGDLNWTSEYAYVDSNITTYVDDNTLPCGTLQYRVQAYKDDYVSDYSNADTLNVNLELISSYPTPGNALEVFMPVENIYIPEWTAFISDSYEGLAVVNCQNPSSPSAIVTYQDLWGDRTLSSFVHGNFVYVATQSISSAVGGIQKVDISDFQAPIISNVTPTSGIPKDLYVDGDFAYLAECERGLSIMYVASSYPVFVSNIELYDARSIHVIQHETGVLAVVSDGLNNGIKIFDVSDPYNPVMVSELVLDGLAADVHVTENTVYLANGEEGLAIIDITDPAVPVLLNSIFTGGFVNGVFSEDNYVYITDYERGFYVIDGQQPSDAYILGSLSILSQPVSVHVAGSYAYVTDNEGLKIIKIKP